MYSRTTVYGPNEPEITTNDTLQAGKYTFIASGPRVINEKNDTNSVFRQLAEEAKGECGRFATLIVFERTRPGETKDGRADKRVMNSMQTKTLQLEIEDEKNVVTGNSNIYLGDLYKGLSQLREQALDQPGEVFVLTSESFAQIPDYLNTHEMIMELMFDIPNVHISTQAFWNTTAQILAFEADAKNNLHREIEGQVNTHLHTIEAWLESADLEKNVYVYWQGAPNSSYLTNHINGIGMISQDIALQRLWQNESMHDVKVKGTFGISLRTPSEISRDKNGVGWETILVPTTLIRLSLKCSNWYT